MCALRQPIRIREVLFVGLIYRRLAGKLGRRSKPPPPHPSSLPHPSTRPPPQPPYQCITDLVFTVCSTLFIKV
jgi:hypothetical protein